MRIIMLICLALVLCTAAAATLPEGAGHPKHSISVQAKEAIFLGESLKLNVTYRNADTEAWHLQSPDKSQSVYIHYVQTGNPKNANASQLGKISLISDKLPNGQAMIVQVAPPKSDITIEAGASYTFDLEVSPIGSAVDAPDGWEVWIEDQDAKIDSARAKTKVVFGPESVPLLLAIAGGDENSTPLLGWARDWLRQIKPDFSFKLPNYGKETKEETALRQADNKKALAAFREFWGKTKDSDVVKQQFARINERANVPSSQPSEK